MSGAVSGSELARVAPRVDTGSGAARLTRRGVLATSLKLAGAGAIAFALIGGAAHGDAVFAQDAATPPAGEVTGEIEVGTTEDAAATDAQVEGEAGLPAADEAAAGDEAAREERRAAREAEGAVGAGDVSGVPATGVGSVVGSPLAAAGAIGLAAASAAAAFLMRRDVSRADAGIE